MARVLAKYYFSDEERLRCNVMGRRGKPGLDPARVDKMKSLFFQFTNTPAALRAREWAWAVENDENTRNLRKVEKRQVVRPMINED